MWVDPCYITFPLDPYYWALKPPARPPRFPLDPTYTPEATQWVAGVYGGGPSKW